MVRTRDSDPLATAYVQSSKGGKIFSPIEELAAIIGYQLEVRDGDAIEIQPPWTLSHYRVQYRQMLKPTMIR